MEQDDEILARLLGRRPSGGKVEDKASKTPKAGTDRGEDTDTKGTSLMKNTLKAAGANYATGMKIAGATKVAKTATGAIAGALDLPEQMTTGTAGHLVNMGAIGAIRAFAESQPGMLPVDADAVVAGCDLAFTGMGVEGGEEIIAKLMPVMAMLADAGKQLVAAGAGVTAQAAETVASKVEKTI